MWKSGLRQLLGFPETDIEVKSCQSDNILLQDRHYWCIAKVTVISSSSVLSVRRPEDRPVIWGPSVIGSSDGSGITGRPKAVSQIRPKAVTIVWPKTVAIVWPTIESLAFDLRNDQKRQHDCDRYYFHFDFQRHNSNQIFTSFQMIWSKTEIVWLYMHWLATNFRRISSNKIIFIEWRILEITTNSRTQALTPKHVFIYMCINHAFGCVWDYSSRPQLSY